MGNRGLQAEYSFHVCGGPLFFFKSEGEGEAGEEQKKSIFIFYGKTGWKGNVPGEETGRTLIKKEASAVGEVSLHD